MLFTTGIDWHDQFSQVPRTNRPDFTTFSIFSEVDCGLRCTPCVRFNALVHWMSWSVTCTASDIAFVFVYYLPCTAAAVSLQSLSMWKYFGFCAIVCLMVLDKRMHKQWVHWHRQIYSGIGASVDWMENECSYLFLFSTANSHDFASHWNPYQVNHSSLERLSSKLSTCLMQSNRGENWINSNGDALIRALAVAPQSRVALDSENIRLWRLRWHHFIHVDSDSVYGRTGMHKRHW